MYVFFLTSFITMAAFGLTVVRPGDMPEWMDDTDRFTAEAITFISILVGMAVAYIV